MIPFKLTTKKRKKLVLYKKVWFLNLPNNDTKIDSDININGIIVHAMNYDWGTEGGSESERHV